MWVDLDDLGCARGVLSIPVPVLLQVYRSGTCISAPAWQVEAAQSFEISLVSKVVQLNHLSPGFLKGGKGDYLKLQFSKLSRETFQKSFDSSFLHHSRYCVYQFPWRPWLADARASENSAKIQRKFSEIRSDEHRMEQRPAAVPSVPDSDPKKWH